RRVTRTEHDGSITVIADRYEGKRLNSPNDVVVKSDGSIWFTDPAYGIDSDYEGFKAESEIGACYVYRVDPSTGAIRVVADDFVRPNGLAFSPDERFLYIADTANHLVRTLDPATGIVATLALTNIELLTPPAAGTLETRDLPAQTIAPGATNLRVHITTPQGYRL
ncbi:MAG: gluconolactonase, partial [Chloroflexota bacterium]